MHSQAESELERSTILSFLNEAIGYNFDLQCHSEAS